MSIDPVIRNIGRRYPDWLKRRVLKLAEDGVNQLALAAAAEVVRIVGATAATVTPGPGSSVTVGFAGRGSMVDVICFPDGLITMSVGLSARSDGSWAVVRAANLVRKALWRIA